MALSSVFKKLPTLEKVKEHLRYDQESGLLYWVKNPSRGSRVLGRVAGRGNHGYIIVRLESVDYFAHRLAWLLWHGEDPGDLTIDHINMDRSDNKIINLRLATRSENQRNHGIRSDNKSGYKNVCWDAQREKWVAIIKVNKVKIHAGFHSTPELASLAAHDARQAYHESYARHS